ncbi:Hypothetical predicted protein [Octopus vulgaris]|uniref:Uncharacterized protein n=2 Tax=Octopus TaxID=6643 RepID=A0AA36AQ48_OCTVU|nr:uncharacterized protein LOC115209437 [Octopus sinensis]CAI9719172.1 Hypothetical predicted protein [Octopus vulgaris]
MSKNTKDKSIDEIDLGLTPVKRRELKQYNHKLSNKLLLESRFSGWLEPSKTNIERTYCKFSRCKIQSSVTHLERHGKTDKHIKNVNSENKCGKLTDFLQPTTSCVHKLCSFIAEHNLPVRLMNHLPGLIQNACPDSQIAKDIKRARTKAFQIYKNILGPYYFENFIKYLKEYKFSLIVDETTDVIKKTACST